MTSPSNDLEGDDIWGDEAKQEDDETASMSVADLRQRIHLLQNDIRIMKSDVSRIMHESRGQQDRIKENQEKVKVNKQLPYLVANVVEILEPDAEDGAYSSIVYIGLYAVMNVSNTNTHIPTIQTGLEEEDDDAEAVDVDAVTKTRSAVVRTSTRQTIFLPIPGLVNPTELQPSDLVGTNKDSYLILEKLPEEFDSRVQAMEVDERPTEQYSDIGGADAQIQELIEAVVLPMTHRDMFATIGIRPPKGVLLHGPPGTGKTLLARACANQTKAIFLKLAGPQLVQMFIGDGAKLIRDAFDLAKAKIKAGTSQGAILFIDEIDAIGTKRFGGDQSGDREVQRTMLELLSQLDGFGSNEMIKVIAATNRPDVLDPALLRSGRLDRKIELPHPTEDARAKILQIHSRKMNVGDGVVFAELARSCEDFNGAQLKAICVEAGMLALRRESTEIVHEDFVEAITVVAAKKKGSLDYFA